jgi:hypothetical protein
MGGEGIDLVGAPLHELLGGSTDRAAGVDHVVDDHAGAVLDVTDDLDRLDRVLHALHPALVHDGEVGVELVRVALRHLHPAGVRRHHDHVLGQVVPDVVDQHRHGREVVDRAVEEPLDLPGVQVDGHEPVGAHGGEHVGHQLGGDRFAVLGLPILAGVPVVGDHGGDPLGRRPAGGVDHDELLHDHVVHRQAGAGAVGLDDEHVSAPDVLTQPGVDLAVGELHQVRVPELHAEVVGDLLGQREVRPPRQQVQPLLRDQLHGSPLTGVGGW